MSFLCLFSNGVTIEVDNTTRFHMEDSSIDGESRRQIIALTKGERVVAFSGTHAEVCRECCRLWGVFGVIVPDIEN